MNSYRDLWTQLTPLYDESEAKAMVRTVLEVRHGLSLADILCGKVNELSAEDRLSLQEIITRLQRSEPVQYVLGEALFAGRRFQVAPGVLIPRTETAELCEWIVAENARSDTQKPTVLDIGTGSGCIAVTLSLDITGASVWAWDISTDAIKMASENARALGASVHIGRQDALHAPHDTNRWDIIVSNPPYIRPSEAAEMEQNVLRYEPREALFIPEHEPLLFYKAIAQYAMDALKPGGRLYFEINPLHSKDVKAMLKQYGFMDVEVRPDTFGKERMVRASRRLINQPT